MEARKEARKAAKAAAKAARPKGEGRWWLEQTTDRPAARGREATSRDTSGERRQESAAVLAETAETNLAGTGGRREIRAPGGGGSSAPPYGPESGRQG